MATLIPDGTPKAWLTACMCGTFTNGVMNKFGRMGRRCQRRALTFLMDW